MIKRAFTLIELIFVIVIFAIISMFGTDLYTKIYSSYIHTRAVNQLEERTQNAITIISTRLEERIRGTVIARRGADNTFVDIHSATTTHDILEWIGQSVESRNLPAGAGGAFGNSVGWSGFVDTNDPSIDSTGGLPVTAGNQAFTFLTQGSNLNSVANVIQRLRNSADGTFGLIFRDIISNLGPAGAYG
ncbi:MAG: prepilin-type N-terminal cleavage/methylation domain-containing protein, partial [Campylobacter sp.]|nr:prepilin-type N-terminal cleavage/methylation domain-containing protein [Campylobacter sp.]